MSTVESTVEKSEELSDSIKNFGSLSMVDNGDKIGEFFVEPEKLGQEEGPLLLSGREKLKRHWTKVGGRVFVPERWGHEGSLREWMDYSSFDTILAPKGLTSAREALMSQGKRARSGPITTSTSGMLKIPSRGFVPDRWGHEGSLRECMDHSSFDTILAPKGLTSAREALISQGKRARSDPNSTSTSRMHGIASR